MPREQCDQIDLFLKGLDDIFCKCWTTFGAILENFNFYLKFAVAFTFGPFLGKIGLLFIPASVHTVWEERRVARSRQKQKLLRLTKLNR